MSTAPTSAPTFLRRPRLRAVPGVARREGVHLDAATGLPAVVRPEPVPVLGGGTVEYANLDHAASTPALERVVRAVEAATRTYSSVHRGTGWLSRVTSAHYEAAREEVARFVGAREDDVVVLTRNTTDSVNLLARSLPAGTPVVVFGSEHHASLLPWRARDTVRLPVPATPADAEALLLDALDRLGATGRRRAPRTPLVVLAAASNVTGELWPVEHLTALVRARGARVLVDAAQSVAHRAFDLTATGADWVAFSGHKLHAPYGTGALVGRRDWLDAAQPYLAGGGASAEVTERGTRWAIGAARHEAGSPNVIGAVALAAACATLREHRAAVRAHEDALTTRLLDGLRAVPGVTTHDLFGPDHERGPVATFTVDGLDSGLVAAALSAEHGIGVRAGKFCAHLLVDHLLEESGGHDGTGATHASAVRVSAGLATTPEHVERLLAAVASLAAHGPSATYRLDAAQGWVPEEDDRVLTAPLPW